jgi:hypothetical protein
MLQKIRDVRQDDAPRERHWFQDDFFDLFAWTDGQFGADGIEAEFERRGMGIDLRVRDFIRGKISEAGARLTDSTR